MSPQVPARQLEHRLEHQTFLPRDLEVLDRPDSWSCSYFRKRQLRAGRRHGGHQENSTRRSTGEKLQEINSPWYFVRMTSLGIRAQKYQRAKISKISAYYHVSQGERTKTMASECSLVCPSVTFGAQASGTADSSMKLHQAACSPLRNTLLSDRFAFSVHDPHLQVKVESLD